MQPLCIRLGLTQALLASSVSASILSTFSFKASGVSPSSCSKFFQQSIQLLLSGLLISQILVLHLKAIKQDTLDKTCSH